MKVLGRGYIDYWQGTYAIRRDVKSRFGIRVREGRCSAVVQVRDYEAITVGKPHEIPVDLSNLPLYLRMIVDDHQLNYPTSDLTEVLIGNKSFREAFGLPEKIGVARELFGSRMLADRLFEMGKTMSTTADPAPQRPDEHELDFLKSELALSLTFSVLAALKYKDGDRQSADKSMAHADEAASTVFQFLSNPRLYGRLTDEGLSKVTLEAEQVKKRLEIIRRNGTDRNVA